VKGKAFELVTLSYLWNVLTMYFSSSRVIEPLTKRGWNRKSYIKERYWSIQLAKKRFESFIFIILVGFLCFGVGRVRGIKKEEGYESRRLRRATVAVAAMVNTSR